MLTSDTFEALYTAFIVSPVVYVSVTKVGGQSNCQKAGGTQRLQAVAGAIESNRKHSRTPSVTHYTAHASARRGNTQSERT
jgi:hypothetical protein